MRLVLVRHGQTPSNVAGALDTGAPGAALTELGHRQAEAVVGVLGEFDLAGIYASDRVRTQLTAGPLSQARDLRVPVLPGFAEISAGDLEMRTDDDSLHSYMACVGAWIKGDLDHRMPGGYDGHDFLARFDAAVDEVASAHGADDTVVVISHGAAIRSYTAIRARDLTGEVEEVARRRHLANTGSAVLEGDPDAGWVMRSWTQDPVGGAHLLDQTAHDITGEATDEALEETSD